jgi:endonuclease III
MLLQVSEAGSASLFPPFSNTWHFATISLMATQSKSQFLTDVHAHLKRRYKPKPDRSAGRLSVLEAVVYGICHEDTTREQANQALSRFKDQFFDWNEVRVSPLAEVQETLADIPDPQGRAKRIRRFLRQLFNKTYGFSLEPLTKKPLKEALKVLHPYEAFSSDYVTATVIQQALGGHAIPIDSATRRALDRLGIADSDLPSLRSILEHAVPKNRGVEFLELLEELAHDTCVEPGPDCPRCELRKMCPTALARKHEAHHAAQANQTAAKAAAKAAAEAKKPAKKIAEEAAKERPNVTPAPAAKKPPAKQPPPPPKSPPGKRGGGK